MYVSPSSKSIKVIYITIKWKSMQIKCYAYGRIYDVPGRVGMGRGVDELKFGLASLPNTVEDTFFRSLVRIQSGAGRGG